MQQEYVGRNQIAAITNILSAINADSILLFKSKNDYGKIIYQLLSGNKVEHYHEFSPNPKYEQIQAMIPSHDHTKYRVLIAMGGGSVIDFAKAYKFYTQSQSPLIAIPTTAGTGTESTQFAVIYLNNEKHSLDDATILPNYAIVDSQFLDNCPQPIKACTALDAYCQAIESYWSVLSTNESKEYAKASILLANDNLEKFVLENHREAANNLALAAHLAGKAINLSRTTAAHALSYKITSKYGIAHGHAVALSMADLFAANLNIDAATCQDKRGLDYVKITLTEILEFLGLRQDGFKSYWHNLLEALNIQWRFTDLGINNPQEIINSVDQQRLLNNPKNLAADLQRFWRD